ncbi:MAG: fatty acid desaturase, partial [Pirellulaceae bacterium]
KDPEFWPYNLPGSPRSLRLFYAWLELLFGWIVTPWLYSIRTTRAWPALNHATRRRLVIEWLFLAVFWAAILAAVGWTNTWTWFLVGHFVPAWITGSVQTLRKFTEHLGRFGNTIQEMTRTVVYTRPLGRAASSSQLHVEHHGTHHRWPRIPYHNLPAATPMVYKDAQPGMVFPNHLAAIRDMLPHLADPKLGPQWIAAGQRPKLKRQQDSAPAI